MDVIVGEPVKLYSTVSTRESFNCAVMHAIIPTNSSIFI